MPIQRADTIGYEETKDQAAGGRWESSPQTEACVFFAGRTDRTPSAQDIQFQTPPQDTLAGNLVVAADLPLRASLFNG